MNASKYNRVAQFYRPLKKQGSSGAWEVSYDDPSCFAFEACVQLSPLTSRERYLSDSVRAVRESALRMAWTDQVTEEFRVTIESLTYEVIGIAELGMRVGLELTLRQVQ